VNLPIQEIFVRRDFRTRTSANSRTSQTSDSVVSRVHDSGSSQVHDLMLRMFKIPDLHKFATPRFASPELRIFAGLGFRSFTGTRFQIFTSSRFLKTHFTNFVRLDVSRVIGFLEFPNTSPLGKRVNSDDPIPRKSQNFSKKRHPQNVRVVTRPPEISQRSNRCEFLKLPPSPL
jgi:hypothetical protein